MSEHTADIDAPTVCIAHGAFIPCRKNGEHRWSSNPYWVKSVRDYQEAPFDLTWEPAWERVTPPGSGESSSLGASSGSVNPPAVGDAS